MKARLLRMGSIAMVLLLSAALLAGCTPKRRTVLSAPPRASQEQKPVGQTAESAADQEAAEQALREQTLREQTLREQDLKRQAAGQKGKTAQGEAADRDAALLKLLQIPDIYFDYDNSSIKPQDLAILKAAAEAFLRYPKYTLLIEGHCDERGSLEYNLALGQKRADEAAKYLIALGIAKERIKTISYGQQRPADPGHDEAAWAKNRRDHFVLSGP